jgi:hypothetical protein
MLKKLGAKEPGTRRPIDAQPQQEGAPVKAPGKNEKGSRSAEASRSSRARAWRRASALRRHPNSASDLITV